MSIGGVSIGSRRALRLYAQLRSQGARRSAETDAATRTVGWLLASRLLVWIGALGAMAVFGVDHYVRDGLDPTGIAQPFATPAVNTLLAPTVRYDSVWYLTIAHSGYFAREATAFFPLLPLLLRLGADVFGSAIIAGTVISLAAMTVAGYVLYLLARDDLDARAARATVLLLAVFPTSIFLSAIYTESLFLALTIAAIYAGRRERWALAAVLGALAGATRSTGLLVLVPLVIMYFYGPRDGGVPASDAPAWVTRQLPMFVRAWPRFALLEHTERGRRAPVLWLALVPAGVVAYCGYLAITHGAPLAPFSAESYWYRAFAGPFGAAVRGLLSAPGALSHVLHHTQRPYALGAPLGWQAYQLVDLPYLAFGIAGLWFCWRRLPFAYFAYALALLCQALSYPTPVEPMESFSRYLLVIFPVFMGWGAFLGSRPVARRALLGVSALALVATSGLWGTWIWVA